METMRFSIRRKNRLSLWRVVIVAVMALFAFPLAIASEKADSVSQDLTSARGVFQRLQTPALDILGKSTRLDMLDYWDADSVYRAKNAMSGLSWLVDVASDYLKVQLTPVSVFEIKILKDKDKLLAMTVYTVGGNAQAADSQINFYADDSGLAPLDTKKYFKAPELKAFFDIPKGSVTTMKEINEMIPFPTVEYSANAKNNDISARLTVGEFMDVDDYNIVKLFLKPELTLKWNGKYK